MRNTDLLTAFGKQLRALRDLAVELLPRSLRATTPAGGLYLFARSDETDSRALAARLLAKGVATMPGVAFGSDGERHLRITFCVPEPRLREGMRRLAEALD